MRPALFAFFLFAGSLTVPAQAATSRTWTDTHDQHVEAALVRVEDSQVVLKLPDGKEMTVPLTSLSQADRDWVAAQEKPEPTSPPAEQDWPRSVMLPEPPTVKVVSEDPDKKEFIYETEHYEFLCDSELGANLVREFSRIFETTWLLNCVLPLDLKPRPEGGRRKFRARIYTYESDYREAGGPPGSAGVYSPHDRELMLPLSSLGVKMFGSRVVIDYGSEDYGTLVHEITHQMMNHWIPKLPTWYVEGSAEYVEMTKYANGRFSFLQEDENLRKRLIPTGGKFEMLGQEKLMNLGNKEWLMAVGDGDGADRNYASATALTYFFYHIDGDGKGTHFKEYLRAVEKLRPGESSSALVKEYLLRGRSHADLQKEVQRGLRRHGVLVKFTE